MGRFHLLIFGSRCRRDKIGAIWIRCCLKETWRSSTRVAAFTHRPGRRPAGISWRRRRARRRRRDRLTLAARLSAALMQSGGPPDGIYCAGNTNAPRSLWRESHHAAADAVTLHIPARVEGPPAFVPLPRRSEQHGGFLCYMTNSSPRRCPPPTPTQGNV